MCKIINYNVNLYFLPHYLQAALINLNINYLTEIRLRRGQPVIIQYRGEYNYINGFGITTNRATAIICESAEEILYSAMQGNVYVYSEQLKNGFITVDGGVRIGVAGEYVLQGENVLNIKNISSLNVRIPHDVTGIAQGLHETVFRGGINNTLIFSPPGFGKTTLLRDLARLISKSGKFNVLLFDERNEIAAINGNGGGFDLGGGCDVVRGGNKLTAFSNAIRAMRPDVIMTDEIYGDADFSSVNYAVECGIKVIASTHTTDKNRLKLLPFDTFAELHGIGKEISVYDKNFNFVCNCSSVGRSWDGYIG